MRLSLGGAHTIENFDQFLLRPVEVYRGDSNTPFLQVGHARLFDRYRTDPSCEFLCRYIHMSVGVSQQDEETSKDHTHISSRVRCEEAVHDGGTRHSCRTDDGHLDGFHV